MSVCQFVTERHSVLSIEIHACFLFVFGFVLTAGLTLFDYGTVLFDCSADTF